MHAYAVAHGSPLAARCSRACSVAHRSHCSARFQAVPSSLLKMLSPLARPATSRSKSSGATRRRASPFSPRIGTCRSRPRTAGIPRRSTSIAADEFVARPDLMHLLWPAPQIQPRAPRGPRRDHCCHSQNITIRHRVCCHTERSASTMPRPSFGRHSASTRFRPQGSAPRQAKRT
jgi:hypothetical protein